MDRTIIAAMLGSCIAGVVILSLRLVLRKVYFYRLDLGDYLAALAMLTLIIYIPTVYISIIWGTPNIEPGTAFTPEDIHRRTVGGKCVLVARVMYISTCVLP